MTREILFKGFHKDSNGTETIYLNGEEIKGNWVYGDLLHSRTVGYLFIIQSESKKTTGIIERMTEVIPETVSQFTGLTDKNDKKIFKNDIVKCKLIDQVKENGKWVNKESYENYEVVYSEEDLGFRFKDEWRTIWQFNNCELEVIGTIFDKKEVKTDE